MIETTAFVMVGTYFVALMASAVSSTLYTRYVRRRWSLPQH
jgi:hypothetical protein